MPDQAEAVARRAAERLRDKLGADLPIAVDAALAHDGRSPVTQYSGDALAIADLIINAASLAWTIYTNRPDDPTPVETITRTLRVRLETPAGTTPQQRDAILEVVAQETHY